MRSRSLFVDESFRSEIDAIRMQEYARASGFVLDLTTLKWKQSDTDSFVMAAQSGEQLVSSMRGEVISDLSLLEKKLECSWEFPLKIDFPVLLLSRAATLSSHRSQGLNLVLRYWFLRFAQHHSLPFVVGTFVTGSPRERTLAEMGYRFFENKVGWRQSTYRSLRPVQVVALDMKTDGAKAMQYCLDHVGEAIKAYPMEERFPELRFVRGL